MTVVHPVWQRTRPEDPSDEHCGWTFAAPGVSFKNSMGFGNFAYDDTKEDPFNGAKFVRDLYELADEPEATKSVPILWDTKHKTIVNNESSEIIKIFNSSFNAFAKNPDLDLNPVALQAAQKEIDDWSYEGINNGVYKAGFANSQEAYDISLANLYASLDKFEALLSDGRKFATGKTFTLTDIRLWMTIARFDEVYVVYFKCDKKKIVDYEHIFRWCKNVWKVDGIKQTLKMKHIKEHYYTSHPIRNHYGIVPAGPNFLGQLDE